MVVEKFMDELPVQIPYLIDPKKGPHYDDLEEHGNDFDDWGIVNTSDVSVTLTRADPGATVDWHSHAPDFYQIHVILDGKIRWYYRDNDGEEQHIDAEAGEAVYLPGGCENKIEVLGDEEHRKLLVIPRLNMSRMEYFLKDGGYPRKSEFEAALVYDDKNDVEVDVVEEAILNLEEVREKQDRHADGD